MLRNCFEKIGIKACLTAGLVTFACSESSLAQSRPHAQPYLDGQNLIDVILSSNAPAAGGGVDSPGTGLIAAANNVVSLQCGGGGWNWPYGGCAATYNNITGPIGLGLLKAYSATGNGAYLSAAVAGGNYDLTYAYPNTSPRFSTYTPEFLHALTAASGNAGYSNHAATGFFSALDAGTYGPTADWDTADWIGVVEAGRTGVWINLRSWEFSTLAKTAQQIGQPGQDTLFVNGMIAGLNTLDSTNPATAYSDILGLAGAVRGLALVNHSSFAPLTASNSTMIAGIDNLCDLADVLAGLQNANGAWSWHSMLKDVAGEEDSQTTAYAILALIAAQDAGCGPYTSQIASGRAWLWTMQDPSDGGFYSYPGGSKNIEINGEVMSALGLPATLTLNSDVCHTDGTVTVSIDMGELTDPAVGGQFFLQYDNSKLSFVSANPGGAPFTVEVYESVNSGAGTIDYAVGVPGGGPGTTVASTMVVLTFNALQEVCDTASLVTFRAHSPPTQLTDDMGNAIVPALSDLGAITIDSTAPMITCPGNITVECDESTAPANTGMATATDNCDSSPAISYVDSSPVLVNQSNLGAWSIFATQPLSNTPGGDGTADFVNGPASPPLGTGSAHLNTGTDGSQSAQMRNDAWAGTRLDQLTVLGYSTYVTSWNGAQVPYLTIWIDTDGDTVADDRLWFEPTYSDGGYGNMNPYPQPPVALNVWQNWNALQGMWYSDNVAGPGANAFQLSSYIAMFPDATIASAGALGGIRIASGFASDTDVYNCYVDAFTIGTSMGTTQYDFELTAPSCGDYVINRTWMSTDACGNVSSCLQTISVEDSTAPVITCPPNIVVNADAGGCTAIVPILPSNWAMYYNASIASTGDASNPYAVELRSVSGDPSPEVSAMTWTSPGALTFAGVTSLAADYEAVTGCFGGGAPRFQVTLDTNSDQIADGSVFVYWGTAPNFNDCPAAGWHNTGDLINDGASRFDLTQFSGPFYGTHAQALSLVGTADVLRITIAVDASWSQDQIFLVDNVNINGTVNAFGNATATDNCDSAPVITAQRGDALSLSDPYPTGVTTITWTATDACGNSSQCMQTITVNAVNTMLVDLQLAGSFSTTFTRCIRFELSSGGPGTTIVDEDVTFTNGLAIGVPVDVPCGSYTCVTARDRKHTLRRTDSAFSIVGTNYVADFTGGDALVGGNLNDDQWIDILDFGIFVGQFGTTPGANTLCGYVGPHADISGNGSVDSLDFSFISLNFLQGHEANCMGVSGLNQPVIQTRNGGPITRISVKDLIRLGMHDATAGDVNHDGWLDQADVAAFLNSH